MKTIGLIVNPVAGLGGPLGLKGSDDAKAVQAALPPGQAHHAHAFERAVRTLALLRPIGDQFRLTACSGPMGETALNAVELSAELLPIPRHLPTTREMTMEAAQLLTERETDLILFAGGDGTARDIASVVGQSVPILGIPCGVKMHSGVFATTPESGGRLLVNWASSSSGAIRLRQSEVMDIDERELASNRITPRLCGYAMTLHERHFTQAAKSGPPSNDDASLRAAAREIAAEMEPYTTYLIGPGTSTSLVMSSLGLESTLLGIDALRNGKVIGRDLDAQAIKNTVRNTPYRIVLGVTSGQGFVLGRGNQQIPSEIIGAAGWANIIVIASETKLAQLGGQRLYADTGDPQIDSAMEGFVRVRTGAGRMTLIRVSS